MRVIHVAPTPFGPEGLYGGGERYPLELARALARHIPCRLVTFGARARTDIEGSGLEVQYLRARAHLRRHPAHPVAAGLWRALSGADLVHVHHARSAPSIAAALLARARRRPVAVTDHGLVGGRWSERAAAHYDLYLTVSRHSADILGAPPDRTRVVFGGVDPERFRPASDEARAGVLFVGRITPHKGIEVLLRALPAGASLTIAGSPGHDATWPERGYPTLLRRLAAGREVRFTGPVADAELPALHRRARVFALPSVPVTCFGRRVAISELLGLSVMEAMASGLPAVCSAIGGLPEVVRHGETGYLVAPGDVEELHDRLAELLDDDALARRMGRAGRELVLDRFTWDACARRCLEAYGALGGGAA
ncbi:MAG TPA: glycosyltransferase family 4 protein [Actinomycetota bacterium]|nr:glycosyltransferase family 4 protein [Actinomycetota bacterium]